MVDLTHTISPEFPTYFGVPGFEMTDRFTYAKDKLNLKIWTLNEHTGTHIDSPFHFSENGWTVDLIPAANLVCPLCVIDIAARAQDDADAQVTPDDIKAWEGAHGPIPAGACVAMHSGWEAHLATDKFRNADADGVMHFPGFHPEAVAMLMDGPAGRGHRRRHAVARLRPVQGLRRALCLAADQPLGHRVHGGPGCAARVRRHAPGGCPQGEGCHRRPGPALRAGLSAMVQPIEHADASPEVRAVYDDIMATRGVADVNNFWKYLAHDPVTLRRTWHLAKEVMQPGALDR